MRRIWLALAAVLLCVEIGYGAEIEIPAEVTDAVPPEAAALLDGADAAAIHREDIIPSIYPGKSAFSRSNGFDFDAFDWSVQPLNTALCSFSDDDFRRFYASM